MKYALIALSLFGANLAHADVIKCNQTEPFITEIFDTEAGTVKIIDGMADKTRTIKGVKMVLIGNGQIEFRANGKVLRTIDLNREGSDGMSETVYPIAATANNGMWGAGCESSELKAKRQN